MMQFSAFMITYLCYDHDIQRFMQVILLTKYVSLAATRYRAHIASKKRTK